MSVYLAISIIIVSVILISSVLLQHMGTGFGASLGGYGIAYQTKRGLEKVLFRLTIGSGICLVILCITYLVIN